MSDARWGDPREQDTRDRGDELPRVYDPRDREDCRPRCRAVNVTKATLEGLFADELALLQPTPGYMRLLKESVLRIWKARKAAVREEIATAERAAQAIQRKLDRLDEAFLFERSIDIETYDRHAEKLREELTLARIDR